jgi:hypothetical protein
VVAPGVGVSTPAAFKAWDARVLGDGSVALRKNTGVLRYAQNDDLLN